jgi:hypothetical protein
MEEIQTNNRIKGGEAGVSALHSPFGSIIAILPGDQCAYSC